MKQRIPELNIGDPFVHFAKQAFRNAKRFGLPVQFINESIAIVRSAFGDTWLRGELERDRKQMPVLLQRKHPLVRCFTVAGNSQIAEVMELAIYLRHLATVKNLDYVITQMKERYYDGLLQMAYAYRFMRTGATSVELEPPSTKGRKGDILFKLGDQTYLVECYVPRTGAEDTSHELYHSVGAIFDALQAKKDIHRVSIRLRRSISPRDRKTIERTITSMIRTMGPLKGLERADQSADICIDRIDEREAEMDFRVYPDSQTLHRGADWGVHQTYADRSEIQAIRNGLDTNRRTGHRILIWRANTEKKRLSMQERISTMERKISKKLCQARPAGQDTKRVLVVSASEGKLESYDHVRICGELHRRIVLGHSNIFLVLLASRVWTPRNRHMYVGVGLCGLGLDSVGSQALVNKLCTLERNNDILQDW